jgi:hypothetical protein
MAASLGGDVSLSGEESHTQVAVKADASGVYVLNAATSDLTLIRSADGAVLNKIKVCGSCRLLSPIVGSPFVLAHTTASEDDDELTWLDTRTDKVVSSLKFRKDRIVGTWLIPKQKLFAILTSRSLLLWNTETGQLVRRLDDFHNAVALAGDNVIQLIGFQSRYFAERKPI